MKYKNVAGIGLGDTLGSLNRVACMCAQLLDAMCVEFLRFLDILCAKFLILLDY